jgi:putative multiple sugar transport system ATP-binding protein
MMSVYGKSYGSRCEGELYLKGQQVVLNNAKAALNAGISYVSEDRKGLGLILIQAIKTNISISSLKEKLSKVGVVKAQEEIEYAEKYRKTCG